MKEGSPPAILFVIGSGRSGTSIVLEAIACLDGVAPVPRLAGRAPALTVPAARFSRYRIAPTAWVRPSSESTALFAEAGLTQEFQAGLGRSVRPMDAQQLRMSRLARRLEAVRRHAAAETVVVKNTASCGRVPILADTFPRAVFLHVLRQPTAVVTSLLRTDFWEGMTLWWDGRTTVEYGRAEGISQEEVAARHWSRQVSSAAEDLSRCVPQRYTSIRYEDFVRRPAETLMCLEEFGLQVSSAGLQGRIRRLNIVASRSWGPTPAAVTAAVRTHCGSVAEAVGVAL